MRVEHQDKILHDPGVGLANLVRPGAPATAEGIRDPSSLSQGFERSTMILIPIPLAVWNWIVIIVLIFLAVGGVVGAVAAAPWIPLSGVGVVGVVADFPHRS